MPAHRPLRAILVDDHPLLRDGLRMTLTQSGVLRIVAETGEGLAAMALIQQYQPEVVILDIRLPDISGLEVVGWCRRQALPLVLIVLTAYDHPAYRAAALATGASAFLLKSADADEILETILSARAALESHTDPSVLPAAVPPMPVQRLSEREQEVLREIALGRPNKVISSRLGISARTVERHVENLYRKLPAHSRREAILRALELGLVDAAEGGRYT